MVGELDKPAEEMLVNDDDPNVDTGDNLGNVGCQDYHACHLRPLLH